MKPHISPPNYLASSLWSRRDFLQLIGLAGVAATGLAPADDILRERKLGQRFRVVRGTDLLSLEIELLNLGLVSGDGDLIHIRSHGAPGYIVLHFPGQHIAEQSIWDRSTPLPLNPPQSGPKGDPPAPLTYRLWKKEKMASDLEFLMRSDPRREINSGRRSYDSEALHGLAGAWLSGPSQLVFELPQRLTPVRFDLDEILDLCARKLELIVPPDLEPGKGWDATTAMKAARLIGPVEPFIGHHDGDLHDPENVPQTNIEFPSLLHISPYRSARWRLRPTRTMEGRSALFAFELERPQAVPMDGPPRIVKAPGHLFAFGWRPSEEARWPIPKEAPGTPDPNHPDAPKYADDERPKTGSYEATRKLLVKQLFEDNGDITADRFRLSALGATARLRYIPIIEISEEKPSNREGGAKGQSVEEGTLTEWEHKADDGRDHFSKESFSGYWMPFGLPGEVVTITERLLCSPDKAPAGAVEDDNALVDLTKDEAGLTAFLVARKFGRVKGRRTRTFPAQENAEFEGWLGVAGRAVTISRVRILHERTPVIANRGIQQDDQRAAIARGEDVIVDPGDGRDAAREIFWPRIEEFVAAPDGSLLRKLAVFKFPIEVTFSDGRKVLREMPMLFVPTLYKGLELYPLAPEDLRKLPVDDFMPLALPPERGQITAAGLGGGREYARAVKTLGQLLPDSIQKLSAKAFESDKATAHSENGTPAMLSAITDGLNVFLGGFREAIDAEVAKARAAISSSEKVKRLVTLGDITSDTLAETCETLFGDVWNAAIGKVFTRGHALRGELERVVAWGREIEDSVDPIVAAERLGRLLHPPHNKEGVEVWLKVCTEADVLIANRLKALLANVPQDFANRTRTAIGEAFSKLLKQGKAWKESANEGFGKAETEALLAWRKLQIAWATSMSRIWKRKDWDSIFARIAESVDGDLVGETVIALLQKELQQAMRKGVVPIKIGNVDIALPELPKDVVTKIETWEKVLALPLQSLERLAGEHYEILSGVLTGIQRSFPHERGLAQRLQRLAEDIAGLPLPERRQRLKQWFHEAESHLTFALAHFEDGRVRIERFLESAAPGRELFENWREDVGKKASEIESKLRGKVAAGVSEVNEISDTVQRLIFEANPDRVRRHLEELIEQTGGKLEATFREGLDRARNRAKSLLETVRAKSQRTFRGALEEVFALGATVLEPIRGMLAQWLAKPTLLLDVETTDKLFKTFQGIVSKPETERVGWRTALALADLVESLEIRFEQGASAAGGSEAAKQLRAVREKLVQKVQESLCVEKADYDDARKNLAAWETRMDMELRTRLAAFPTAAKLRAAERLEYLIVGLWFLDEAQLEAALKDLFVSLGTDTLKKKLESVWPGAAEAANKLRDLAGEGSDLIARVKSFSAEAQAEFKTLGERIGSFASDFAQTLKNRLKSVEGAALSMAKRAVVSLPSPTLLSEYQDQSRKVVMEAKEIFFSVSHIKDGVTRKFDDLVNEGKQSLRSMLAFPTLDSLKVKLPSVNAPQIISHAKEYIQQGFRDLDGQGKKLAAGVFADIVGKAETALLNAGLAGATAKIEALSREAGGIVNQVKKNWSTINDTIAGQLKTLRAKPDSDSDQWKTVFAEMTGIRSKLSAEAKDLIPLPFPKLFDKIPLDKLLGKFANLEDIPKTISNPLPDRIQKVQKLTKAVSAVNLGIIKFQPLGKSGEANETTLKIAAREVIWLPGPGREQRPPDVSVRGQMEAFYVEISSLLRINFRSLSFTSENGRFKCTPKLGLPADSAGGDKDDGVVKFLGPLEFVDNLRKSIGSMISGQNGFKLSFRDDSIYAGLRIALPTLTLGAVTVSNLSLSFELGLPLDRGPLRFRFALADQEDTFRVAVSIFTGGGFFALTLASRPELCSIEAAIEAGASIQFNAGVAAGGLSAMFGLYFRWGGSVTIFEGYFRACGNVTVLGFIDISIVIYLAFRYLKENAQSYFVGEASIRIRVKIGFFSKSFTLRYEKRIAGSKSEDDATGGVAALSDWRRFTCSNLLDSLEECGVKPPVSEIKPPTFEETYTVEEFTEYWEMFDLGALPK